MYCGMAAYHGPNCSRQLSRYEMEMLKGARQAYWDARAHNDSLGAIRTSKNDGRWDAEEFFATGVNEVRGAMAQA